MGTFKKYLIMNHYRMASLKELQNAKIILITSAGTISGKPVSLDTDTHLRDYVEFTQMVVNQYKQDHGFDQEISLEGNDGYILLKDVVLTQGSTTTKLTNLSVFFEDIIGVSFEFEDK